MTLSRFLRDYLYIPLGGNRHGPVRRHANLMVTMVLGGLWHGAGWNFMIWGFLHGAYLVINHLWAGAARALHLPADAAWLRAGGTALTFVAVCAAWVFFRAPDVASSLTILRGMAGAFGLALPDSIARQLAPLQGLLDALGVRTYLGGGGVFVETRFWIVVAGAITFCLPNTQEIVRRFAPALDFARVRGTPPGRLARALTWRPSRGWAVAVALLTLASLLSLNRPAEFLYFQF